MDPSPRSARLTALGLALTLGVIASAAAGCGDDGRNDAMLFLQRYDALDLNGPVEERREAVRALRALALRNEGVLAARDACASAFEAELRAEDQHTAATTQLLEASAGGAERVSAEAAVLIEAAIQESQEAIDATRELFPRCEREVRALRLRYATPRTGS